jgi:NTE family protein
MPSSPGRSLSPSRSRALVLGGGGPVGRAWQTGLAAGFCDLGVDFSAADLIIGTSAGAIVGAEIALGRDMNGALPAPAPASATASAAVVQETMAALARAAASATPEAELKKLGQIALSAAVPDEEAAITRPNVAGIAGQPWPPSLQATCVNTLTGRLQVWTASSGVALEKALAASSALPGVWPPITIGADRYMDGGVRSMLNADIAQGHDRVIVVSCRDLELDSDAESRSPASRALLREIETLRDGGAEVAVITPDAEFLALTKNGALMLNTALEPDAFDLGRRQALNELARVRAVWGA